LPNPAKGEGGSWALVATATKENQSQSCQSPDCDVPEVMRYYSLAIQHPNRTGNLGANCLGCCWALFAVLVAAGVMSLAWMLLLTALVFVEKVLPDGPRVASVIGLALVAPGFMLASGSI
jgi:predicted metal-binding membrane protein